MPGASRSRNMRTNECRNECHYKPLPVRQAKWHSATNLPFSEGGRGGRKEAEGTMSESTPSQPCSLCKFLQVPASPPPPVITEESKGTKPGRLWSHSRENRSPLPSLAHSASPTLTREVSNKTSRDILVCYRIGPQILWQSAQRSLEPFQPPWFRL